jgi:hypothetical protein
VRVDSQAETILVEVIRRVEVLKKGATENIDVPILSVKSALGQDEVALAAVDLPEILLRLQGEDHR